MDARTPRTKRRKVDATVEDLMSSTSRDTVVISPPNLQEAVVEIEGVTPLVMNKFSERSKAAMIEKQEQGSRAKKGQKRDPKDFDAIYKGAIHYSEQGWYGFPAGAFRAAMVSASRLVGFKMTIAKLSVFVVADGIDRDDGTPLVRVFGEPKRRDLAVRLANGSTDVMPRPFFNKWSIKLRLRWDGDQFSAGDVINLLSRVGKQVGIGAGRHDSRQSTGMGWGEFTVKA